MRFRIVTWNIHKGIGGIDRRYRIQRVVSVLQAIDADIALLQEVAEDMPRSHWHNQAELLSNALKMPHVAYGPEHRFRVGGYGNAILSRWPLSNIHHVNLTIGSRKKRGALKARTRVRFGDQTRTVVVINMHLGLAGTERGLQLEKFFSYHPFERLHRRTPIVLAGDLNDLWGSLGPRFLVPAGFSRAGELLKTFPAAFPLRPLDAIFVRGDLSARDCRPPSLALAKQASDHLPLVAELDLQLTPHVDHKPHAEHKRHAEAKRHEPRRSVQPREHRPHAERRTEHKQHAE